MNQQEWSLSGPSDPEELKKMFEGIFQKMGTPDLRASFFEEDGEAEPSEDEPAKRDESDHLLEFNYLPRDIKAYLDKYVIRQDEAKKALAIAVCDHYNNAKYLRELVDEEGNLPPGIEVQKQNVLVSGPTGVGKTYLIKHIAELIGVPFVKADATKFSETGYVGRDVDDLVRDLVQKANGNKERAEFGIIYIDEIDKLASKENSGGRDVSGRGVQTTLLKLMEETEVPLVNPMDMQSQMMSMMRSRGSNEQETINTRDILFIVSGAFTGLDKIVTRRQRAGQIGFGAKPSPPEKATQLLSEAETQDFIEFGFEAEFIGRLPVRVVCEPLDAGDFCDILKYSKGSLLKQYKRQFEAYGIKTVFEEDAIEYIAELAEKEKTGARALMTVLERLLRDFKYELPGRGIHNLIINRLLLENQDTFLGEAFSSEPSEESRAERALQE